jgi:hypothetical protein
MFAIFGFTVLSCPRHLISLGFLTIKRIYRTDIMYSVYDWEEKDYLMLYVKGSYLNIA